MKVNLTPFEGKPVNGSSVSFQGSKAFPVFALEHGEEVHVLVKCKVKAVDHQSRNKVGLVREHKLTVQNVRFPDQKLARDMMNDLDAEFEEKHEAKARLPLESIDGGKKGGKDAAAGD